jgi:CheY-like chemotaxis protein
MKVPGPTPKSARTIFIVEDDNLVAKIYERTLTKEGYQVEICGDGSEAFHAVYRKKFDLLLLDIMLPQLNGMDFLKKLRVQNRFRDIPIILITSVPLHEIAREAKAAGANLVLAKSQVTPQQILTTVNEIFGVPEVKPVRTLQICFLRATGPTIDALRVVEVSSQAESKDNLLKRLGRALNQWIALTEEGKAAWRASGEEFNIGHLAEYFDEQGEPNNSLKPFLEAEGVYRLKEQFRLANVLHESYGKVLPSPNETL